MEFREILDNVRNYISYDLRGNFDKNSRNLTIEYIIPEKNELGEIIEYNFETNSIGLNKNDLEKSIMRNENEELIKHSLIKGLLLMASTTFKKNRASSIGFGTIERCGLFKECSKITNIGLTSGYTDLLTYMIQGKNIDEIKNDPHAIQIMFSKQIELIVGSSIMQEAYFKENKKQIEKQLFKIDPTIDVSAFIGNITNILYKKTQGLTYYDETMYMQEILERMFMKKKHTKKELEDFKKYMICDELFEIQQYPKKKI